MALCRKSNCIFFALALYQRRKLKGRKGYFVMRRSRWGPFPHILYAEKRRSGLLRVISYTPVSPHHKPIPPVVFQGHSKWGDL